MIKEIHNLLWKNNEHKSYQTTLEEIRLYKRTQYQFLLDAENWTNEYYIADFIKDIFDYITSLRDNEEVLEWQHLWLQEDVLTLLLYIDEENYNEYKWDQYITNFPWLVNHFAWRIY